MFILSNKVLPLIIVVCAFAFVQTTTAKSAEQILDLSGTYDVATLTPLERPKAYGNELYLTRGDAEKIRAADVARKAESNELSDPNREAPPTGGDGATER